MDVTVCKGALFYLFSLLLKVISFSKRIYSNLQILLSKLTSDTYNLIYHIVQFIASDIKFFSDCEKQVPLYMELKLLKLQYTTCM